CVLPLCPSTHSRPPQSSPLSLHDALPISIQDTSRVRPRSIEPSTPMGLLGVADGVDQVLAELLVVLRVDRLGRLDEGCVVHRIRSEEHTSELQSRENLVCRLLLEKKKKAQ